MHTAPLQKFTVREWFWAVRPKTLTTAIIPFLAGTCLAFAMNNRIDWGLMVSAWLSAICIQIGTNFVNDAYDFRRGADSSASLGPQRATRAGLLNGTLSFRQVLLVGLSVFATALFFGIPLVFHGGWIVAVILILSVLAGFLYTGGAYPLAYHGLGDLFVFLFYGGVATNAAYWLQTGYLDRFSLLTSIQVGCLCTSMIAINNLRDVHEDRRCEKNTLPVRFGIHFGKIEITLCLMTPLVLSFFFPWMGVRWMPLLSVPFAAFVIFNVWKHPPSFLYNNLLALSGANMLLFSILQALGFLFA